LISLKIELLFNKLQSLAFLSLVEMDLSKLEGDKSTQIIVMPHGV
jgi:hypothetical protein